MLYENGTRVRVLPGTGRGKPHRLAGKIGTIINPCDGVVPGWYKDIYRIDFREHEIDFAPHHSLEEITEAPVGNILAAIVVIVFVFLTLIPISHGVYGKKCAARSTDGCKCELDGWECVCKDVSEIAPEDPCK